MSSREIVVYNDIKLEQNSQGKYIISQTNHKSYALDDESRTGLIIRILDVRCQAQQRRYQCINDILDSLQKKLDKIESSCVYKVFHKLGLI